MVDATRFTLDGRAMRGVRQMVTRARRAGYTVRVRRSAQLDAAERRSQAELAARWRGSEPERGFSMALGQVADEHDPECLLVTAEHDGQPCGVLQFAPGAATRCP